MSERTSEQIRLEIAAERNALAGDMVVLQSEARRLAKVAGGAVVAAVALRVAVKLLWKLR